MPVEIITKEDLTVFRKELLIEISQLLKNTGTSTPEWMKPRQLRQLLGISAGTLRTWRATRMLRYSKVGGTYYYSYADVRRMMTERAYNL